MRKVRFTEHKLIAALSPSKLDEPSKICVVSPLYPKPTIIARPKQMFTDLSQ